MPPVHADSSTIIVRRHRVLTGRHIVQRVGIRSERFGTAHTRAARIVKCDR
jgi:hypothetical protein